MMEDGMVKVAIVQSAFIPWLGYFNMIDEVDVFVYLDDAQFTVRDWRNRNRIRTREGWVWLTVPVRMRKPYFEYRICEVEIDYSHRWMGKHLRTIEYSYKRSPFFQEVFQMVEAVYLKKPRYLVELNYAFIDSICDYMGLRRKRVLYSQNMGIPAHLKKTDKLLYILEQLGEVNVYLSGPKAQAYLEVEKLHGAGIKVEWHEYEHPYYGQNRWGTRFFITHLSVLDLLFNHGRESLEIIKWKRIFRKPDNVIMVSADEYGRIHSGGGRI